MDEKQALMAQNLTRQITELNRSSLRKVSETRKRIVEKEAWQRAQATLRQKLAQNSGISTDYRGAATLMLQILDARLSEAGQGKLKSGR